MTLTRRTVSKNSALVYWHVERKSVHKNRSWPVLNLERSHIYWRQNSTHVSRHIIKTAEGVLWPGWNSPILTGVGHTASSPPFARLFFPSLPPWLLPTQWSSASCPPSTRPWADRCLQISGWTLVLLWMQARKWPSAEASTSLAGLRHRLPLRGLGVVLSKGQ